MLVDTWTVKAILMGAQPEWSNALLGNGGKTILVIKFKNLD